MSRSGSHDTAETASFPFTHEAASQCPARGVTTTYAHGSAHRRTPLSGAIRDPPTWKAPCIGAKAPAGVCRETLARIDDEAKHLWSGLRRIRGSGARKGNAYFVDPTVNVKISKGSGPKTPRVLGSDTFLASRRRATGQSLVT